MKLAILAALFLATPLGWAAGPYEGTWFTCSFEMAGRRDPWVTQDIRLEGGELQVHSESGAVYSFSGTAQKAGNELQIRGCWSYRGQLMETCDPDKPPIVERLKLPLRKKWPSNLDLALKRGESIFLTTRKQLERLQSRCEKLIDETEAGRRGRW